MHHGEFSHCIREATVLLNPLGFLLLICQGKLLWKPHGFVYNLGQIPKKIILCTQKCHHVHKNDITQCMFIYMDVMSSYFAHTASFFLPKMKTGHHWSWFWFFAGKFVKSGQPSLPLYASEIYCLCSKKWNFKVPKEICI